MTSLPNRRERLSGNEAAFDSSLLAQNQVGLTSGCSGRIVRDSRQITPAESLRGGLENAARFVAEQFPRRKFPRCDPHRTRRSVRPDTPTASESVLTQ